MNPDSPQNPQEKLEASLTSLLLGELPHDEAAALHQQLAQDPELSKLYERLKETIGVVRETMHSAADSTAEDSAPLKLSEDRREKLLAHFKTIEPKEFAEPKRRKHPTLIEIAVAACFVMILGALLLPSLARSKGKASRIALLSSQRGHDSKEYGAVGTVNDVGSQAHSTTGSTNEAYSLEVVGYHNAPTQPEPNQLATPAEPDPSSALSQLSTLTYSPRKPLTTVNRSNIVLPEGSADFRFFRGMDSKKRFDPNGEGVHRESLLPSQPSQNPGSRETHAANDKTGGEFLYGTYDYSPVAPIVYPTLSEPNGKPIIAGITLPEIAQTTDQGASGTLTVAPSPQSGRGGEWKDATPDSERKGFSLLGPTATPSAELFNDDISAHHAEQLAANKSPAISATTSSGSAVIDQASDPEWIGVLEKPNYPPRLLGGNNFVGRYAYQAVPSTQNLNLDFADKLAESQKSPNLDSKNSVLFDTTQKAAPPKVEMLGDLPAVGFALNSQSESETATAVARGPSTSDLAKAMASKSWSISAGGTSPVQNYGLITTLTTNSIAANGTSAGPQWYYDADHFAETPAAPAAAPSAMPALTAKTPEPNLRTVTAQQNIAEVVSEWVNPVKRELRPPPSSYASTNYASTVVVGGLGGGAADSLMSAEGLRLNLPGQTLPHESNLTSRRRMAGTNTSTYDRASDDRLPAQLGSYSTVAFEVDLARLYQTQAGQNITTGFNFGQSTKTGLNFGSVLGGGTGSVTSSNRVEVAKTAKQYFRSLGVDLDPAKNPGNAVFFNDRLGTLTVRGKKEDLEKIQAADRAGQVPILKPISKDAENLKRNQLSSADVQDGKLLYELEKYDEAEIKLKNALRNYPNDRNALYYLSLVADAKATQADKAGSIAGKDIASPKPAAPPLIPQPEVQTTDNGFSTFSLNVSDVSFKLAGASLEKGQMPDPGTVRGEEFINAFDYRDPEPPAGVPVAFAWERAQYPFAQNRDLLRLSLKTAALGRQPGKPLNLVLLLDNSGSMERADRVRIVHEALRVLAGQLQPQDKLSIVVFARTARLWVDGAAGDQAGKVVEQITGLTPEGGTNLEEAMNLAYQTALRHYLANGVNRVVLLTDGAANLGDVEPDSLKQKVETYRKQGVALDCFGIGWEGFNDDLLEALSRNGDGRYGFINSPEEATTEFAGQLAGALHVAASDVKVQIEFNPKRVTAWRQIGYAKHQLTKEQFRDNTVDAAEIAAAESGNALYTVQVNPAGEGPIATVRARFKVPGTSDYREHEWPVPYAGSAVPLDQASAAMRLAATASAFSEWLAASPHAGEVGPDALLRYLTGVPEQYGADVRPKKLEWMIRQAKSLSGK